jgi:hypothetical protein
MKENHDYGMNKSPVVRGETNMYKQCSIAIERLLKYNDVCYEMAQINSIDLGNIVAGAVGNKIRDVPRDTMSYIFMAHIIEELSYDNKLTLLNFLFSHDSLDEKETIMNKYFEKQIREIDNEYFIQMVDNAEIKLHVLHDKTWEVATPSDVQTAANINDELLNSQLNETVLGYMGYYRDKQPEYIFKTKRLDKPRNTGASCNQSNRISIYDNLNTILGVNLYSSASTSNIVLVRLCPEVEFLLRHYNDQHNSTKKWFLTPEESVILGFKN